MLASEREKLPTSQIIIDARARNERRDIVDTMSDDGMQQKKNSNNQSWNVIVYVMPCKIE